MRLTRADLRLLQEGLELLNVDAEFELEIASDDESRCRWATDQIEQCESIYAKLNIVIDTNTNLANKSCDADIILTPRIKPVEYEATFSNPSEEA